jgi:ATP-binding cassette subfamily B protein
VTFLNKYVKRYGFIFLTAILFLSIEALCDLMQPTIMARIVDVGIKNRDNRYIVSQSIIMLGIAFVGALCACLRSIIASSVSQRVGTELRFDLFKKILEISLKSRDKFEEASLMTRLTNDITQVQNFINGLMRIFIRAPLLCIGSIVMAVYISPKMAVVLLVIVPLIILFIMLSLRLVYPSFLKIQEALDKVNTVLREYLSGIRVVKAFDRFDYETQRFEKENHHLGQINMKTSKMMAAFSPFIQLIVNGGIVTILWLGGFAIKDGSIKVGEVIAFISYMTQILFSLSMMSHVFMSFVRVKASAQRIGEVFEEEDGKTFYSLTEEGEVAFTKSVNQGSVVFEEVSFSYHPTQPEPVLDHISFRCQPGETIGIIGSTGAGKSTLVNLLTGFYYPTAGSIQVDGVDIKTISGSLLRKSIAVIPQKVMLFTGSIKENIKWGEEEADLEAVEEAAKLAQAHGFIEQFPEQYDTLLGQGGVNLSGGQKQRISIARALIKKPKILILDDCTSAIDLITEEKIRGGLKNYMGDLTSLIVAQRIISVMEADQIIVLDKGKIAGIGRHSELLKNCQIYQDIFISQLGKEAM